MPLVYAIRVKLKRQRERARKALAKWGIRRYEEMELQNRLMFRFKTWYYALLALKCLRRLNIRSDVIFHLA